MKQDMSSNRNSGNNWGDVYMNQKPRVRVQNDKIYDERGTSNICHSILIRNPGRKLHIREGNIPFCSEYDKPLCGDEIGKRGCGDSMDEPLSDTINKYGITPVHKCVV